MIDLIAKNIAVGFSIVVMVAAIVSFCTQSHSIVICDYDASRDEQAVTVMLQHDWQTLNFGNQQDVLRYVAMIVQKPTRKYKVLRCNNQTIGFVDYKEKSKDCWYVQFIIIDEKYRKLGYASKLL